MRALRIASAALLAGGLAVLLALVPTNLSPAAASTLVPVIPPGTPTPVNVLPSQVTGSFGPNVPGSYQQSLQFLYKMQQSPEFWDAVRRQQAGTATSTDLVRIQQVSDTHRVPATKTNPLQKLGAGVGGVLGAVSTFSLGTMIGATGLDLFGFDREGAVCSSTSGAGQVFVTLLTATDCTAFNEFNEEFVANFGVTPGWTGGPQLCHTSGACVQLISRYAVTSGGGQFILHCFATTGVSTAISIYANLSARSGVTGVPLQRMTSEPQDYRTCGSVSAGTRTGLTWGANQGTNSQGEILSWGFTQQTATAAQTGMTSSNPLRTLKCTVASTTGQQFVGTSAPYAEADGVLPTPNCPDLPPGMDLDRVTVDEVLGDTSTRLWDEQTTDEYQHVQQLAPECAQGTCMLDLRTATGSCFQTPAACLDWFADPNKDTKYSCHYGQHLVDLAECTLYAPTFKPEAKTSGDTLGDPQTGQSHPAPAGAAPGVDRSTFGTTVQNPSAERQCFPTGWAVLNPVEWVTKPVQCALEWAFVPRPAVVNSAFSGVQAKWATTTAAQLGAAISGWAFSAPSGCHGITVDVWFLGPPFQIMQACPGDLLATMAQWTRFFCNIGFAVYGVVAVTRNVARIFEFPGIGSDG